jgi:nitrogen fixation-related uncharacterized protein
MHATKTYRLKPEGVEAILRQMKLTMMAMIVVVFGVFVSTIWRQGGRQPEFLIIIAAALPVVGWLLVRQIKRYRKSWESFQLIVGPDFIRREQAGYPPLEIRREEVRGIFEGARSGLVVRTMQIHKMLFVPKDLEGYEELRAQLQQWRPLEPATQQRLYWLVTAGAALAFVLAHFGTQYLKDPGLLILLHLIAAIGFLWTFVEMRRSPQFDDRTRRHAWVLLLPAAMEVFAILERLPLK